MSNTGKRFLIGGLVQGVFYRRFACKEAEALHITGWAQNLPNGGVEVMAFGDEESLRIYAGKLHQGPPAARVDKVVVEVIDWQEHQQFFIRE